jgi:Xaa-Pro aminopeptidase
LIATKLLTHAERAWLDSYHRRVYRTLASQLRPAERAWLRRTCAPL